MQDPEGNCAPATSVERLPSIGWTNGMQISRKEFYFISCKGTKNAYKMLKIGMRYD